jgi:hypothetical protein
MGILTKWFQLGLALGIEVHVLEAIRRETLNVQESMTETLLAWLRGRGKERCWTMLCKALRDPIVVCGYIAEEIEANI